MAMRFKDRDKKIVLMTAILFTVTLLLAGSGDISRAADQNPAISGEPEVKEIPLDRKYGKLVFEKFAADPQLEADYPGSVAECEASAVSAVKAMNLFRQVDMAKDGAKYADALRVRTKVTNLRIVSGAARFWGGAFAGASDMTLQLELVDAASGKVLRQKELSTSNNPFAASWTFGKTDRSLPSDLGNMVAQYIAAIQPPK